MGPFSTTMLPDTGALTTTVMAVSAVIPPSIDTETVATYVPGSRLEVSISTCVSDGVTPRAGDIESHEVSEGETVATYAIPGGEDFIVMLRIVAAALYGAVTLIAAGITDTAGGTARILRTRLFSWSAT